MDTLTSGWSGQWKSNGVKFSSRVHLPNYPHTFYRLSYIVVVTFVLLGGKVMRQKISIDPNVSFPKSCPVGSLFNSRPLKKLFSDGLKLLNIQSTK